MPRHEPTIPTCVRVPPVRPAGRWHFLAAIAVLLASVTSVFAGSEIRIVGGSVTSQWPGIGALATIDGLPVCTGTLVGVDLVLTSASCVSTPGAAPALFLIGPDTAQPQRVYEVAQVHVHPGYSAGSGTNDIALARLAETASEVPSALRSSAMTSDVVGAAVRIIGYGRDEFGVSGIKRSAATAIDFLFGVSLGVGFTGMPQTCSGDSGGPMITTATQTPLIHGVSSFQADPACQTGALYHRIDTPEVRGFLAGFAGVCLEGGACTFADDWLFRYGNEPP